MEEKKNTNQAPELQDAELEQVATNQAPELQDAELEQVAGGIYGIPGQRPSILPPP